MIEDQSGTNFLEFSGTLYFRDFSPKVHDSYVTRPRRRGHSEIFPKSRGIIRSDFSSSRSSEVVGIDLRILGDQSATMTGWLDARTKMQGPLALLSFVGSLPSDMIAKVGRGAYIS